MGCANTAKLAVLARCNQGWCVTLSQVGLFAVYLRAWGIRIHHICPVGNPTKALPTLPEVACLTVVRTS